MPADRGLRSAAFAAMGSDVELLLVDAPDDALEWARTAIHDLERRWSRFQPDSEISALNTAGGATVQVSPATAALVALAVDGWRRTDHRFDPTVLDALEAAGYDRSFELVRDTVDDRSWDRRPAPGCAGITIDGDVVCLPAGVRLDPGGLGKGLAADLVAQMLVPELAAGALVSVGGDLRVAGTPPEGVRWRVGVDGTGPGLQLQLSGGGVATSSTARRRWRHGARAAHHLIDPRTGAPSTSPFVAATVVAGTAHDAEVLTKAVMLSDDIGQADALLRRAGAAGLVRDDRGWLIELADVERLLP